MLDYKFLPTAFATYLNEIFYLSQRFGIFFLFEKENACKRKANSGLRPETPRTPRRNSRFLSLLYPIIFSIAFSNSSFCSGLRFCGPFVLPPAMRIFFAS